MIKLYNQFNRLAINENLSKKIIFMIDVLLKLQKDIILLLKKLGGFFSDIKIRILKKLKNFNKKKKFKIN